MNFDKGYLLIVGLVLLVSVFSVLVFSRREECTVIVLDAGADTTDLEGVDLREPWTQDPFWPFYKNELKTKERWLLTREAS